jgi:hypothetical protein
VSSAAFKRSPDRSRLHAKTRRDDAVDGFTPISVREVVPTSNIVGRVIEEDDMGHPVAATAFQALVETQSAVVVAGSAGDIPIEH